MAGSMSPADPGGSTGAVATPRWLAWMLGGRRAETVGFLWGVAEASLFFVVPDVWTGWIAIVAPRRAVPVLVMTLLGAVLGALLLFLVAPYATDALVAWFGMVPGLLPGDLVTWDLNGNGLWHIGIVVGPDAFVHNIGAGPVLETGQRQWTVVGHYRYHPVKG